MIKCPGCVFKDKSFWVEFVRMRHLFRYECLLKNKIIKTRKAVGQINFSQIAKTFF